MRRKTTSRLILTGMAVVVIGSWVVAWTNTPTGVVVVRRSEAPWNPTVTTSLGDSCVAPCYINIYTWDLFDLTLSAPGYYNRTERIRIEDDAYLTENDQRFYPSLVKFQEDPNKP